MKKYSAPEKFTVFTGEEVNVLDQHLAKTSKNAVSQFSEEELEQLQLDLDGLQPEKTEKVAKPKAEKKESE